MSQIKPLDLDVVDDELKGAIQRNIEDRVLSSDFQARIWAHRPEAAQHWLGLLSALNVSSSLSSRLRELVRLKIASITNCQACQLARKSDDVTEEDITCLSSDDDRFSEAEQAALCFAELFATDYFDIGDREYERLQVHFTDEQIVDLNMFVAMMLAGGRMTYVQRAYDEEA